MYVRARYIVISTENQRPRHIYEFQRKKERKKKHF